MNVIPMRIGFEQARAIVDEVARQHPPAVETIPVGDAIGRIAAEAVAAPLPLPPFDNSAMDGFAFRHADLPRAGTGLRIVGDQFAGRAQPCVVGPGDCVRITTGAPLPMGADTVVVRENATVQGAVVTFAADVPLGAHVRRAGEDVQAGDTVVHAGQVMTPSRLAMLASLGFADVRVARRPTIAIVTTGDELVEPGHPLPPGTIYNSNRTLLLTLLRDEGLEPSIWPTVPDDVDAVAASLREAASRFDVVITCGAVSAGEKDFIPECVRTHGRIHFWKVRMKPGMPVLFGSLGPAHLLALPGNPVSVLATWLTLGRALVDGLQGRAEPRARWQARLADGFDKRNVRLEFLRGRLHVAPDATLQVTADPADGSHRLAAAARANALIVLPEGERRFEAGDLVDVLPL